MDMVKFYCNVKIEYKPKGRSCQIPIVFLVCLGISLAIINVVLDFTY